MRTVYFDRFPPESGLAPCVAAPVSLCARRCRRPHRRLVRPAASRQAAARKIKEPVLVGELYLDRLYKLPLRKPAARDISRFQPVRRDFSLVLDQNIPWERIDQALASLQIPELVEWRAARSSATPASARTTIRCSSAPLSRHPTAPCAKKNSNRSNLG